MECSTEHYKLVVTPRYVRLDHTLEEFVCRYCNGTGYNSEDWEHLGFGDKGYLCGYCMGDGKIKDLSKIPPPPEIDKKFLEDLQSWVNNYVG